MEMMNIQRTENNEDRPRKYVVIRPEDTIEVLLMKNVSDGTWSFVNLTKGHICECRFMTADDGERDMDGYIKEGRIINYIRIC